MSFAGYNWMLRGPFVSSARVNVTGHNTGLEARSLVNKGTNRADH